MKIFIKTFPSLFIIFFLTSNVLSFATEKITDQQITLAVEDQIINDPGTDLNNLDITTTLGVVTINGKVENILKKERSIKVAQIVKGVRSVIDKMKVVPDTRADSAIEHDIIQALVFDPVSESWEINVKVDEGVAAISGEVQSFAEKEIAGTITKGVKGVKALHNNIIITIKGTRPDSDIQQEIVRRLQWDTLVDNVLIDVEVDNDKVVLSGVVGSVAERIRASTNSWVVGVKAVDASDLEVNWWAKDSKKRTQEIPILGDREIQQAVEDSLLFDPRVGGATVIVSVDNGIVTLSGGVKSLSAKGAAATDARNTVGVWSVKNHLRVQPAKILDDKRLAKTVENALIRDPIVERYEIDIVVLNGVVYLSGMVDSYYEKAIADHIVSNITGVRNVRNRLKIEDSMLLVNSPYIDPWYIYDYVWYNNTHNSTFLSDILIESEIRDELFWSPFVDSDQITVTVDKGHATLKGKVDSWFEYRAAYENAIEGGAVSIDNEILVTR